MAKPEPTNHNYMQVIGHSVLSPNEALQSIQSPPGSGLNSGTNLLPFPIIKDSGKRQEFETGSRRDTRDGKGRFDLLPCRAIKRLARHFENGSRKYGDRNWEKGQPLSRYMDSALRHAFAHLQGQRDEDHIIAAVWNLMCFVDTEERINEGVLPKELNDMPLAK